MEEKNVPELKLTFGAPAAAATAEETKTEKKENTPEEKEETSTYNETNFTEEEQKIIDEFSEKIDITDSALVLGYGAAAQKKVSDFSDATLEGVRTKDFGETGEMISELIAEIN